MAQTGYDPQAGTTLINISEFIAEALVAALRERFDERAIELNKVPPGYMVVLPPALTLTQLNRIRLFTEGWLACHEWYRQ